MKYKDTLFRAIFKEPKQAILLYNVIANHNYDVNTKIEMSVLDEMLFTTKQNDVSFIIEDKLVIFIEHQSTINNNMPLRFLEYLSANYRYIKSKQKYSSPIIKLPKPEFYVLYNGSDTWNKEYLKLSDAFEADKTDTFVELVAKVINIKPETATVDIRADDELFVYATFVEQVQKSLDSGDDINTALKKAREHCLGLGVSSSLLDKWKEVQDMYLEEFDYLDDVKRQVYVQAEANGLVKGKYDQAVKTAKKMLLRGVSIDDISDFTELDINVISALA